MGQGSFKHQQTQCISAQRGPGSPTVEALATSTLRWVRTLARGGHWVLRLAQLPSSQYVAVKVLNKAFVIRAKQLTHAFNERTILRQMCSPFIVQLVGTAQDARNLYCVMEFAQGGDLFSRIYSGEGFDPSHAQFYLAEVVIAVSHLHAVGCLYRDLKPENVLLSSTGHVKLSNFGISKILHRGERTFTTCGTPEYLAPEMIEGSGYESAVDWWQVGILLYEMIAGQTPFIDSDPYILYQRILTAHVEYQLGVFSSAAESLISWLLSKEPERRPHIRDVVQHRFFANLDWAEIAAMKVKPPFVPALEGPDDSRCFEKVEERQESEESLDLWQQMLFHGY